MPKRVRPPESSVTMPLRCGSSLRSTNLIASSKLAILLLAPLPAQLLLDRVEASLHLFESLIEHALAHLLLLPRNYIAIEALFQLASGSLHVGHARRERSEIRDPSADENSYYHHGMCVHFQPSTK